jgi:beta-galactosidase
MVKMSLIKWIIILIMLSIHGIFAQEATEINLNFGWRFAKGEQPGAYAKNFDDKEWRVVDVPHDWSIEDMRAHRGPLDENAVGQWDVGYMVGGKAWYRKTFKLDSLLKDKIVHLQFDGIYMNAAIWINNYHAGSRAYGYSTFWIDITPYVDFGGDNIIAVEVKNLGMNSRWYSGSGIYRPVQLRIMDNVHIGHWGPAVRTPKVSAAAAEIDIFTKINSRLEKDISIRLISRIKDQQGEMVASTTSHSTIKALGVYGHKDTITISKPVLWSPESPFLYTLSQDVEAAGEILDHRETTFGIRSIDYNAKQGFLLNGSPFLLRGACVHHDHYMLGSAAYDRAEERKVQLLKAAGYNAIRCAHNPPSQAFLDACDKTGVLVIDEAFDQWTMNKWDHDQDYGRHFQQWWQKDIESMVCRDRNHPCIIMWSIGNEIPEQGSEYGICRARALREHVKQYDPTRPVTFAANKSGPGMDDFFRELDIVGYNYRLKTYESDQARVPDRVSYGSESYTQEAFDYWQKVESFSYILGDFVWTGWDYLGEASIGWNGYAPDWSRLGYYPWHAAYCGEIDLTGYKRPASYYRDVLWKTGQNKVSVFVRSPEPSLQPPPDSSWNLYWTNPDIHPSWSWPGSEGKTLDVVVYSACEEAELFLNGKSLGRKVTSVKTAYKAYWDVVYEPGELRAIGYIDDKKEAEWLLKTAGKPAAIRLVADRKTIKASGSDLSYITAELFDKNGNRVYNWHDDLLITFEIEGEGKLAGVGNACPTGTESFQRPQRTTFRGRCLVVLKSTFKPGLITVKAKAKGVKGDALILHTVKIN